MAQRKRDTSAGYRPTVPATPDIIPSAIACIRLDGRLDALAVSPALHQVMLGMARIRNIVSSLRIEGQAIDLDAARRVLETEKASTPQERETLRLSRIYSRFHNSKPPPLTVESVCALHREVFRGSMDDAGKLKTEENGVRNRTTGEWLFLATPPKRTRAELEELFRWLRTRAPLHPPPVAAGLFFAEFQAIHPFHDGNGRIGRLLNIAVLRHLGLRNPALVPLDGRFFRTHDKYYEYLSTTNDGRTHHLWVRYYVKEMRRAYEIAASRGDLRGLVDRQSRPSNRAVLEWVLTGDGSWFAKGEYPNPRGYSGVAVYKALWDLSKTGVLEARGQRKGRRYRLSTAFLSRIYGREFLRGEA